MRRQIGRPKILALIFVIVAVSIGISTLTVVFHLFGSGMSNCSGTSSFGPNIVRFTVTMSANGYNDSKVLGLPRPVMNVSAGKTVTIHIQNQDHNEAHGFTIIHYFEKGIVLNPGGCYNLTLTVDQVGTFKVFCQIFCLPHAPWMQEGELNVNP